MNKFSTKGILALSVLMCGTLAQAQNYYYRVPAQGLVGSFPWSAGQSAMAASPWDPLVDAASAGGTILAMTANGDVYAMGDNCYGEFGDGAPPPISGCPPATTTFKQVAPASLTGGAAKVIRTNFDSFILARDGSVWFSGRNLSGEAGVGSKGVVRSWTKVPGLPKIAKLYPSFISTYAVAVDGTLWSTGDNYYYQRGLPGGSAASSTVFQKTSLPLPAGVTVADVVSYGWGYSTTIIDTQGNVWTTGNNHDGTLGTGVSDTTTYTAFTKVPYFNGNAVALASTTTAVAVLTNDGVVHTTGNNQPMDTGRGDFYTLYTSYAPAFTGVQQVGSGEHAIMAAKGDGLAYSTSTAGDMAGSNWGYAGFYPWSVSPVSKFGGSNKINWAIKPDGSLWLYNAQARTGQLTQFNFKAN